MFISLLISTSLFCGLSILFFIAILNSKDYLSYKKQTLISILFFIIGLRLIYPFEFPFTKTIGESIILPAIIDIMQYRIFDFISLKIIFIILYIFILAVLLSKAFYRYIKLQKVISIVPTTKDVSILNMVNEFDKSENIKTMPKIVVLDIDISAFVLGIRKPTIVLSSKLSQDKQKAVLLHEFQHLKLRHLPIKFFIELICIVYWWFPLMWVLKREFLKSLELQADMHAIRHLSYKERKSYLEILIDIAKHIPYNPNIGYALSFTGSINILKYRITRLLDFMNYDGIKKKVDLVKIPCIALLSLSILMSCLYTFEAYHIYSADLEGSFSINDSSYFIMNEENEYELYSDGMYQGNLSYIPKDLEYLEVKTTK